MVASGLALRLDDEPEPWLLVDEARLPLARDGLRPILGKVVIGRAQLSLRQDPGVGLLPFARFPKRGGAPAAPLERLPLQGLEVYDLQVEYDFPTGTVKVRDLFWGPPTLGDGPSALRARVDLTLPQGSWTGLLVAPNLALSPEGLQVPELHLSLPGLQVTGAADLPLQGELRGAFLADLDLRAAQTSLKPPRTVSGLGQLQLGLSGTLRRPALAVNARTDQLYLQLPGAFTPLLDYRLGSLALDATLTPEALNLHRLAMEQEAGGRLTVSGRVMPDLSLVDGRAQAEQLRLGPLLTALAVAPTPWVDFVGTLEASLSGSLKPLALEGPFRLEVADFLVADRPTLHPEATAVLAVPSASAEGWLKLAPTQLELDVPEVALPRSRGSIRGTIGFGPRGPLDLELRLPWADLRDAAPLGGAGLEGQGSLVGRLRGPFNRLAFYGGGDLRRFACLGIPFADHLTAALASPDLKSLQLRSAVATVGETTYTGDLSLDFRSPLSLRTDLTLEDGRLADLVGMFLDFDGLDGEVEGSLHLEGPLSSLSGPSALSFRSVNFLGEQFPSGFARGHMHQGTFTLEQARLVRAEGREGLMVRGSVERAWALNLEILADGFSLQGLDRLADSKLPLAGQVGLHAQVGNTLFEPEPHGLLTVRDVRYDGLDLEDSQVWFDTQDGKLQVTGLVLGEAALVDGQVDLWTDQNYAFKADLSDLPAHLFYPRAADGQSVSALLTGQVAWAGAWGESPTPVLLEATLPEVEVVWSSHRLRNPRPWSLRWEGESFDVQDVGLADGSTQILLTARGDPTSLDVMGEGTVDLDLLRAVVPDLTRAAGSSSVRFFATGTGETGQAVAEVELAGSLLRHAALPSALEDVTGSLRFTKDGVQISRVQGGVGGGTFRVDGQVLSERWFPQRLDLGVEVADAQLQWVDSLPPAIGGAQLRLDGPLDQLLLAGAIDVKEMDFSDRIDWEDWLVTWQEELLVGADESTEPGLFGLDLQITAPDTILLRNNVAEGRARAELRLLGDTGRPGLTGTVRLSADALAFLQDREFRVERGLITFHDPFSWDPEVDFALLTDLNSQEQRYRVSYDVFGPFSAWQTQSRSDPPLPQADVNALLWFGVTTQDLEEMGALGGAVTQAAADLLLADFFIAGTAGEITEDLPVFVDRFDLVTGVNGRGEYSADPRLVAEKRLIDLGDVGLRWELNLLRPDDNYVTAERRIGGVWLLRGWYASLQRDRILPIGGAYGLDVTARWETD